MRLKFLLNFFFLVFLSSSVFAALPTITSFTPSSGAIGTLVTITGTNMASPTAFTIGGKTAIVISNTGTQVVGMVMPGAVSGNIAITTAGGATTSSSNFTVTATLYPSAQQGSKVIGTGYVDKGNGSKQGFSVAVSADGKTAVVGGFYDNNTQGAIWVYTNNGSAWAQQGAKLVASNGVAIPSHGYSVGISADGNTIIEAGLADNNTIGAAWIFTRSGTTWTQQQKLVGTGAIGDAFQGSSTAMSADGNTVAFGGYYDNNQTGAVWVFTRNGATWTQQGNKLVGTGYIDAAQIGFSLALSADGNTLATGGVGDNSNSGAIWVFTRSGTTWTQQGAKIVGTGAVGTSVSQGYSVALSADGNTLAASGNQDNNKAGAIWIYTRSGSTWTQQGSKLIGTGGISARQGNSVALSADGNTLFEGGCSDNSNIGACWAFTRDNSAWTQQGAKITGTGVSGTGASQGYSVGMSADGGTAMEGGPSDNTAIGAAWGFKAVLKPTAITAAATNVAVTSATLNGSINDNGAATTVSFEYSTNSDLSNSTVVSQVSGLNPIPANTGLVTGISANVSGLSFGTTYYFRINGTNSTSTTNGNILSFTTPTPPPSISYGSAQTYTAGNTITPLVPTNSGGPVTSYTFIGSFVGSGFGPLPAGLSFDTATGIVSGTPSTTSASTTYHVLVRWGTSSSTDVTFTMAIVAAVAPNLSGNAISAKIYPTGTAITPVTIQNTGGATYNSFGQTTTVQLSSISMSSVDDAGDGILHAISANNIINSSSPYNGTTSVAVTGGTITGNQHIAFFGTSIVTPGTLANKSDVLVINPQTGVCSSYFGGNPPSNPGYDIASGSNGSIYLNNGSTIKSYTTGNGNAGTVVANISNFNGKFVFANGIFSFGSQLIYKIGLSGQSTFAGGGVASGTGDGIGTAAHFTQISDIIAVGNYLYVTDAYSVRQIDTNTGMVTTIAGNSVSGLHDGPGASAGFSNPRLITYDASGLLVIDGTTVRRINITRGFTISPSLPAGLTLDNSGTISGTPTVGSADAIYTVTAQNSGGSSSTTVHIATLLPPPVITSFAPATGPVGTLVTITGTNLVTPGSVNIGGVPAIIVSSTATQVVAMVMPGAGTGAVSITNASGTGSASSNFMVTPTSTMGTQRGSQPGTQLRSANASSMGNKVAISADGNTAAASCTDQSMNSGPVMIYSRSNNTWSLTGQLPSGVYTGIALSADGKTLACGVPRANGGVGSLSVYTQTSGTWALQSTFSGSGTTGASALGTSVSLSADGNTAVAGGNADNSNVGAIWVFKRTGNTWAQQGNKLVGSGNTGASGQGSSVSISADGNTVATGGSGDNSGVGAIWVFSQTNNVWLQQGNKIIGSGYTSSARQGVSVALSADGNTLAEGGSADDNTIQGSSSGACWVFTRNGEIWNQQDGKIGQLAYAANMGTSISVSADGRTFIAGAPGGFLTSGSVNVCSRASGTWQILNTNIMLAVATTRPAIGTSVAVSADGNTGIIGAPSDRYNNNPGIVTGSVGIIYGSQTPVTTTQAATDISTGNATLNGTVNDNGATTTVSFEYGTAADLAGATTASVTTGVSSISAGMGIYSFTKALTGLAPGTTYYFRITGVNSVGTTKGDILSFKTSGNALDKINTNLTASAAYSLRQLKTTYTHTTISAPTTVNGFTNSVTPVVRVRRSADDGLLDIGYTANGDLDTVTLKSFAGTGNAYVAIWYDQSGSSFDVTQTVAAQQPLLVSAGVIERSGLKPAVRFVHAAKTVLQNNVPASAMFGSGFIGSVFPVYEASPAGTESSVFGYANSNYAQVYDRWQIHDMSGVYFDVGNPMSRIDVSDKTYAGTMKNYSLISGTNLQQIYVNGTLMASGTPALTPCTQTQFNIGGIPAMNTFYHEGHESEILVYNSSVTDADRKIVENNQAAYYLTTAQPVIASFSPDAGYTGTVVTIKGKNFTGTNAVQFGGTAAAAFTVTSDTTIVATAGSGSTGSITITTPSGTIASAPFYFGTPLDKLGVTAIASAAYSLRQLKSTYQHKAITAPLPVSGFSNATTPVIRVRRSPDDQLLDIGYTANGDLDTLTLKNFVGTGNGYVAVWYDQGGNSYDVTQTVSSQQPLIVSAGNVERSGVQPAVRFVNQSKTVLSNNIPALALFGSGYIGSVFPVYEAAPAGTESAVFGYGNSNYAQVYDRWLVHDMSGAYLDVGNPTSRISYLDNSYPGTLKNYSFITGIYLQQIYVSGALKASSGSTVALTPCTQTQFNIGGIPNFGTYFHEGHESEIIVYNSTVTDADRQTVETNQYNYYIQPVIQPANTSSLAINIKQPTKAAYSDNIGLDFVSSGGKGTTTYQVQKLAANGAGFVSISTMSGDGTGNYKVNDANPLNGDNFYKVIATDSKGNIATSETVKLSVLNGGQGIQVYPVPVKNKQIVFNFSKMIAGTYDVVVVSKTGYLLAKQSIRYDGYASSVSIPAPANKPTDVYFITISSPAYKRTEKVIIE